MSLSLDTGSVRRDNVCMWVTISSENAPHRSTASSCNGPFRMVVFLLAGFILAGFALVTPVFAQSQNSDSSAANSNQSSNQSWSSTSETSDSSVGSRTRTLESHTKTGNHSVDKQTVEIQRSGSYEPYQDIER